MGSGCLLRMPAAVAQKGDCGFWALRAGSWPQRSRPPRISEGRTQTYLSVYATNFGMR